MNKAGLEEASRESDTEGKVPTCNAFHKSFATQVARIPAWLSPEREPSTGTTGKRRVVILGTGWAAHAIAKIIDINKVEIRVISPRNYFVLWLQKFAKSAASVAFGRSM